MIGRNGERGSGISALAARHDDEEYRLCDDRDEAINCIISKRSKQTQMENKLKRLGRERDSQEIVLETEI